MKIWVLVTMPFSGGHKKLVRGFDTEAEARRIAAIIDECDPRYALDIEEIEVEVAQKASAPLPSTGWWQQPVVSSNLLAGDMPQSPAASFAEPEGWKTNVVEPTPFGADESKAVTYEEPMPHMENFR